jgi:hypothetical protein
MGRPDTERDSDLETVGMYGIGMKRAIFKMGTQCSVTSQTKDDERFRVEITPDWIADEENWELTLASGEEASPLAQNGTEIEISQLHKEIASQFDRDRSDFLDRLHKEIARSYALFLRLGFRVTVGERVVEPVQHELLAPTNFSGAKAIEPYMYRGTINGVTVELVVGFTRRLASEEELDAEAVLPRSQDDSGWTIICNDRVVLHNDKGMVTGWGRASVPKYHNQFICIAGVVTFRSKDSLKLPLNTTKRGLDSSSGVYLAVLDLMTEGVKKFTNFTNKWKGRERETGVFFSAMHRQQTSSLIACVPPDRWSKSTKHGGEKFLPFLPLPKSTDTRKRISFQREEADIAKVSRYLFDGDPDIPPSEVGEGCFDVCLDEAVKTRRGKR